jgi:hypothetical protein
VHYRWGSNTGASWQTCGGDHWAYSDGWRAYADYDIDNGPAATVYYQPGESYHLQVYALDDSGNVRESFCRFMNNECTNDVWLTKWGSNLGSPGNRGCSSAIAATSSSNLYVFCRVTANYDANQYYQDSSTDPSYASIIWVKFWNGSSWSGWQKLGTTPLETGPAATNYMQPLPGGGTERHLQLYSVDAAGNLQENFYSHATGSWSGWHSMGAPSGGCKGDPAAASLDNYNLSLFCRGGDNAIWWKRWDGYSWSSWQSLGGTWLEGPGATRYYQPGDGYHLNVYAVDSSGTLKEKYCRQAGSGCANNVWYGWQLPGSDATNHCQDSPDATYYSSSYLYVFCRDKSNGEVDYKRWTGSQWLNWNSTLGKP